MPNLMPALCVTPYTTTSLFKIFSSSAPAAQFSPLKRKRCKKFWVENCAGAEKERGNIMTRLPSKKKLVHLQKSSGNRRFVIKIEMTKKASLIFVSHSHLVYGRRKFIAEQILQFKCLKVRHAHRPCAATPSVLEYLLHSLPSRQDAVLQFVRSAVLTLWVGVVVRDAWGMDEEEIDIADL